MNLEELFALLDDLKGLLEKGEFVKALSVYEKLSRDDRETVAILAGLDPTSMSRLLRMLAFLESGDAGYLPGDLREHLRVNSPLDNFFSLIKEKKYVEAYEILNQLPVEAREDAFTLLLAKAYNDSPNTLKNLINTILENPYPWIPKDLLQYMRLIAESGKISEAIARNIVEMAEESVKRLYKEIMDLIKSGQYGKAEELITRNLQTLENAKAGDYTLADLLANALEEARLKDKYIEAVSLLSDAISGKNISESELENAIGILKQIYDSTSPNAIPQKIPEKYREFYRNLHDQAKELLALAYDKLAEYYMQNGDYEKAVEAATKASVYDQAYEVTVATAKALYNLNNNPQELASELECILQVTPEKKTIEVQKPPTFATTSGLSGAKQHGYTPR